MARGSLKSLLPERARQRVRQEIGVAGLHDRIEALSTELHERIASLESQLHESREEAWERSRDRWRKAAPTSDLTWAAEVTGDAFVAKADEHGAFGAGRTLLEVGPGYGRILAACLDRGAAFGDYIGLDLSPHNVQHLNAQFPQPNVRFMQGDVESFSLEAPIDTVLSSLTFKHLFPSFERALENLSGQMRPGGTVVADLIEGERRYFEPDGVTYIRWYTRPEIDAILDRVGLERVAFDEVRHVPDLARLLVVARKPG